MNSADETEVPAILYRPKKHGKYPAVLFQHGRRGLDELVQRLLRRMAARGFDFWPPAVCTFADDLAAEDATLRAAAFMHQHLKPWRKKE